MELLFSVGHHLGVAVAKLRSDSEARRLSLLDERNALAHELHDSLAQTLANLRFQVGMLDDSLQPDATSQEACRDLERVTIQLLQLGHWGAALEGQDERVEKIVGLFAES